MAEVQGHRVTLTYHVQDNSDKSPYSGSMALRYVHRFGKIQSQFQQKLTAKPDGAEGGFVDKLLQQISIVKRKLNDLYCQLSISHAGQSVLSSLDVLG